MQLQWLACHHHRNVDSAVAATQIREQCAALVFFYSVNLHASLPIVSFHSAQCFFNILNVIFIVS